jgi:hypothetical protein
LTKKSKDAGVGTWLLSKLASLGRGHPSEHKSLSGKSKKKLMHLKIRTLWGGRKEKAANSKRTESKISGWKRKLS